MYMASYSIPLYNGNNWNSITTPSSGQNGNQLIWTTPNTGRMNILQPTIIGGSGTYTTPANVLFIPTLRGKRNRSGQGQSGSRQAQNQNHPQNPPPQAQASPNVRPHVHRCRAHHAPVNLHAHRRGPCPTHGGRDGLHCPIRPRPTRPRLSL